MITPYLSEKSVVVLDDIHWSKEMHQAWQILQSNQSFCYSVDLFYKGLLFREPRVTGSSVCQFLHSALTLFNGSFWPAYCLLGIFAS